ncbi:MULTISPECIES: TRAP transporter small permease [Vibrio]|uniref:TRAP transporter small permease protein n=1 Tax=Vibrio halioticoli NBRC 102217 TaxID=1219072 RepID=V5FHM3_9VIBR|nr:MULTISPECIES: TRAP transporter small permease [Vibrio]MPW37151.1 TRAP transporter small permease subunit [Vibrio sp. B1Z05]GAD88512.1 putative TRAP transporter small permease protein [Vibrio halioticoli NBRC 102217]
MWVSLFSYIIDKITKILGRLLVVLMWLIVATVVWQVFTRFFTNSPSTFTDELSRYLLIWIGILGGAYTYSLKRHLAIELLITKVKNKNLLTIMISLMVIVFSSLVLIYGGSSVVMRTLQYNQVSPTLSVFGSNLPMGYIYLVAPIAGVLINLFAVNDIMKLSHDMYSQRMGN